MEAFDVVLLLVGGTLAGIVNAMAGGGSLLTVPLLVVAGVPGVAANGSNRVGILTSSISSYVSFRREGKNVPANTLAPILLPGAAGAAVGAFGISQLTDDNFETIFGLIMLPLIVLTVTKPKVEANAEPWSPATLGIASFAIGIYAGAVQAGMGLLTLAIFSRSGMDLVTANVVKVLLAFAVTVIALPIFILEGQVRWLPALVLAIGLTTGGWIGAKLAVRGGEKPIRILMVIAAIALALRLLGFWDWLFTQI